MRIVKKSASFVRVPLVILFLLFQGLFISDAFAYLDPGSGSIIIQMIIGALVGIAVTLKVYWEKVKFKLSSRLHRG